jgi:hypothetical protein
VTGDKVGIIDPTIKREHCFTISDRSLAAGGGVVEAILSAPQFANVVSPVNAVAGSS